jgi:Zn-dependent M16 (insulinase) family peptidase
MLSFAGRRPKNNSRSLFGSTSAIVSRWSSTTATTATPKFASPRGALRAPLAIKVGDKIGGFDVVSVESLPDFDATLIHSIHRATGCEYVHTDSPDTNNVFGATFRTLPEDDSGTPHILEHTVLCGSKQYPVRDPFFRMMKRSLNTFMNAMTAGEYTMYPFSTQNEQDFDNLANVYLDLLFFPNLRKNDFMQEGHRLELNKIVASEVAQADAPILQDEELVRSGVVYNEMKGTLSDSSTLYGYTLNQKLLPGTMSSAGLPHAIPDLTHEKLVDFHRRYYHPSNALFFTYGDMPIEQHIERVERLVLSKFEHSPESANLVDKYSELRDNVNAYANSTPNVRLSDRDQWPERVVITGPCDPVGDMSRQNKYSISFLLQHDPKDPYIGLVLGVLDSLLSSGPGAPLYDRLIESRLATAYCPSSGMSLHGFGHSYTIGGDGVAADDASLVAIEDAILEGLQDVADKGFEERRVAAVLHQLELSLLYKSPSRGLSVMQGACVRTCVCFGCCVFPMAFSLCLFSCCFLPPFAWLGMAWLCCNTYLAA